MEALAGEDYRDGAKSLKVFGGAISHAHAGRVLAREGARLREELFGEAASVRAAAKAPANPAELLIVSGDGSRYRTNEADRPRGSGRPENARAGPKREFPARGGKGREEGVDRGWRENKIGVVIRALPGREDPDGTWHPPEEQVKTYTATTGDIHAFGRELRAEAERRGIRQARQVVFVSDFGHGLPAMREREFSGAVPVADIKHAGERITASVQIVLGTSEAKRRQRAALGGTLRGWLWKGKVEAVIERLRRSAARRAPRPETLSALDGAPEARTLWEHVQYFEGAKGAMDYPAYRAKGWPISSSTVESACGQFGARVTHARMRWTREGADALHRVKAAILSQDGRWEKRWPPPIPVLELPAA